VNLQGVFAANAAKLRDLHDAIHSTLRRRDESQACRAAWEEVCRRFHAEYDSLAFPGGLGRAFSELEAGNPTAIEMAVQFWRPILISIDRAIIKWISSNIFARVISWKNRRGGSNRSFCRKFATAISVNFEPIAGLPAQSQILLSRSSYSPSRPVGP
jgi:hypothetical protein